MASWWHEVLGAPRMNAYTRHTYIRHRMFVILDAMAVGILGNAPMMALKGLGTNHQDWQLALQIAPTGIGMILVLYLSNIMSIRHKKPFVLIPGFLFFLTSFSMAFTGSSLLFLSLLGLGATFEVVTRSGIATIIRFNYPSNIRAHAAGTIRRWHYMVFLFSSLSTAALLDTFQHTPRIIIMILMLTAAGFNLASFFVFQTVKVNEHLPEKPEPIPRPLKSISNAFFIVRQNPAFRTYLAIGFVYCFGALIFAAFFPAFLMRNLGYDYLYTAFLIEVLPKIIAFFLTGPTGKWLDRVNVWKAWAIIRLGWGLDPLILILTPAAAIFLGPAACAIPFIARSMKGIVMGGSWILWWQIGVNHFVSSDYDTSRYIGIITFVNGLARLIAPVLGAVLLASTSIYTVFIVGGLIVIISSLLSVIQLQIQTRAFYVQK